MKTDVRIYLALALGLGLGLALLVVGSLPVVAEGQGFFDLTGDCPGRVGDVAVLIKTINTANGNRAADTITLAPNCLYTLDTPDNGTAPYANGLPLVTTTITINGQGSIIQRANDAATAFRIFRVESNGTLHLKDLTIRNGEAIKGGGIVNQGNLELSRCTVDSNLAHNGQEPPASEGYGGGIYNNGRLTMTQSTVSNNEAHSFSATGGGLMVGGTAWIENSTISGNTVGEAQTGDGGGIFLAGDLTLINTTVASNTADTGGGIRFSSNELLTLRKTIIANNAPHNCYMASGSVIDQGGNIQYGGNSASSCSASVQNLDPKLDVLADNGGPSTGSGRATWTHALMQGSAAIDFTGCVQAPATDQRGVPRPQGFGCDSGAYEAQPKLAVTKLASTDRFEDGDVFTYTIVVANQGAGWATDVTISDPLPSGLDFLGPITLDPPSAGAPQTSPPLLAQCVTVAPGESVTITFPVTVTSGTEIVNVAFVTSDEVPTPVSGSVTVRAAMYRVFLPLVLRE